MISRILCTALVCALVPGCFLFTTKHEGSKLRTEVNAIDKRLAKQEQNIGDKVNELEKVLENASRLLARNSADIGADVEFLKSENAKLTGLVNTAQRQLEEVKKELSAQKDQYETRVAELEERLANIDKKLNTPPPKSASEVLTEAKGHYENKDYAESEKEFRTFVVKFPKHPKAAEAQLWRAESVFGLGKFEAAIGEFQKVFDKYPKSSLVDDALYRAGETAERLKWCADALVYYTLLKKKHPRSKLVSKAKKRLSTVSKRKKNKKFCSN